MANFLLSQFRRRKAEQPVIKQRETILKTFLTAFRALAASIGLLTLSTAISAALVNVVTSNSNERVNHYSTSVTVTNDGTPAPITDFKLYFSEVLTANLALTANPAILCTPDLPSQAALPMPPRIYTVHSGKTAAIPAQQLHGGSAL